MIEKKCKECGKIFLAKSARQVYCTGEHYRPCPVCGKPVLIKYLSDPTPKCADCRKGKQAEPASYEKKQEKSVDETVANKQPEDKQDEPKEVIAKPQRSKSGKELAGTWMYIGNPYKNGFIPGHEYEIYLERVDSVYEVSSKRDVTEDKVVNIMIPFSSRISIDRNFSRTSSVS